MKKFFRFFKLQTYKVIRIKDFPESVAIGLAWCCSLCNAFIGITFNHLLYRNLDNEGKSNSSYSWNNFWKPLDISFFFYLDYKIGVLFYFEKMKEYEFKLNFLVKNFEELFFPTFFGSIPVAILVWLITYNLTKKILEKRLDAKKNKIRS